MLLAEPQQPVVQEEQFRREPQEPQGQKEPIPPPPLLAAAAALPERVQQLRRLLPRQRAALVVLAAEQLAHPPAETAELLQALGRVQVDLVLRPVAVALAVGKSVPLTAAPVVTAR